MCGQQVLLNDRHDDQHRQQRPSDERYVPCNDNQNGMCEQVHVFHCGLVRSIQSQLQLVIELIEIPEVYSAIRGPSSSSEYPRLALQELGI